MNIFCGKEEISIESDYIFRMLFVNLLKLEGHNMLKRSVK